jgi:hypothetical protein
MTDRKASHIIWTDAHDCDPPHGLDMDSKHDSDKVAMLVDAFQTNGFDKDMPALVGYPSNGRIQLLSRTHRHHTAKIVGIKLPIVMRLRSIVEAAWCTLSWDNIIKDIPVKDLEFAMVQESVPAPGLDERVDLSKDIVFDEDGAGDSGRNQED